MYAWRDVLLFLTGDAVIERSYIEGVSSLLQNRHSAFSNNIDMKIAELVVSSVFQVSKVELHGKQRGSASIAYARHVSMYLMHVACGVSFTAIGRFFGRDRTTVAYACQRIEDNREDHYIDWALNLMELSIKRLSLPATSETI